MSARKLTMIDLFGPESDEDHPIPQAHKKGQAKKVKKHHSGHKSSKKKEVDIKMEGTSEEHHQTEVQRASCQLEWLREKEDLINSNNMLRSQNETLAKEIARVVKRMEAMEKGEIPTKTIALPYHEDGSLDLCKRSDRCHTYHLSPACFACGEYEPNRDYRHSMKSCPNLDNFHQCVYPLCHQRAKHAIQVCQALHSVCRRCKGRGHMSIICSQYSDGYKQLTYEQYRSNGLFTKILHPHFLYNNWRSLEQQSDNDNKKRKLE